MGDLALTLDPDTEYLTTQQVAEYIGVNTNTIYVYLSTGRMPEPDAIYLRRSLWLVSTIDAWRKERYKHGKVRVPRRVKVKARAKKGKRPPRLTSATAAKQRKPSSNGASPKYAEEPPDVSAVAEPIARQIAAALRSDGFACTTDDVMTLSMYEGELDHERFLLQQRIRAKIRGLKQQKL